MKNEELSAAMIAYLGFDTDAYPHAHNDIITQKYGIVRGVELIESMHSIFNELRSLSPDWTTMDTSQIWRFVEDEMRGRHPELTENALQALGFAYTYWWK